MLFYIGGYLLLCFMVALLGRRSRLGLFRGVLFSIMFTPFLVTLYLLIFETMESEASEE